MKIYRLRTDHCNEDVFDQFTNKWKSWAQSQVYFPTPREIPDHIWKKYEKLREEFWDLHDFIADRFDESYDPKIDGPRKTSKCR